MPILVAHRNAIVDMDRGQINKQAKAYFWGEVKEHCRRRAVGPEQTEKSL